MEEKKEDDQQNTHRKSVPIYPGSRLTIGISALLVMAVVIRHSLTGQALNDILKLIWLHCLGSSEFLRSINELKKCFCDISSPMTFHWYCSFCFMLVDKNKEKCCPNSFCRKDFTVSGSLTFFVEVPIVQQIKRFFAKTGFYNDIQGIIKASKCLVMSTEHIFYLEHRWGTYFQVVQLFSLAFIFSYQ